MRGDLEDILPVYQKVPTALKFTLIFIFKYAPKIEVGIYISAIKETPSKYALEGPYINNMAALLVRSSANPEMYMPPVICRQFHILQRIGTVWKIWYLSRSLLNLKVLDAVVSKIWAFYLFP